MKQTRIYDLTSGATDGYLGGWQDGEAVTPVTPDLSIIGGKPPKKEQP